MNLKGIGRWDNWRRALRRSQPWEERDEDVRRLDGLDTEDAMIDSGYLDTLLLEERDPFYRALLDYLSAPMTDDDWDALAEEDFGPPVRLKDDGTVEPWDKSDDWGENKAGPWSE